ncbi:unnamed protein product [Lactuca saligna]|uniref:Helicase XPB/Ssl2 N-terminal domain-containing protein n=1 Tax=Lactuca saligna TaxID=75948 RepID=A0AA35VV15_LACSI|nr:unnamed protein product [Lactuca saligna]
MMKLIFHGEALFQTHDNLEHLAMMERVLGPLPEHMVQRDNHGIEKYFRRFKLKWPEGAVSRESIKAVCVLLFHYAAVSVGLETETIIAVLNKLSKSNLPKEMIDFTHASTSNYGKVKLVLKKNRYLVESPFLEARMLIMFLICGSCS